MISEVTADYSISSTVVPPNESPSNIQFNKNGNPVDTQIATNRRTGNDNFGDLIYKWRENRDRLLLREVVINRELTSDESDLVWYATIPGARISSVRALNFGRSRGACYRIDVAGSEVQVVIRIPPLGDPRIMIEVYGY